MCFGLTQIIYSFLQVLFDLTGTKPYMSPELHIAVDLQIFIPIHVYILIYIYLSG